MASFSGFGAHRALKAPMLSRRGGFAHAGKRPSKRLVKGCKDLGEPRGQCPCGDMWRARWRYMGPELREEAANDGFRKSFAPSPERKGIGLYANGKLPAGEN